MHCVDFFFFLGFFWAFLTIFAPNLSIYRQKYVKNGFIFKTANLIFFFNAVHNLISFSMVFTNKNGGGAL